MLERYSVTAGGGDRLVLGYHAVSPDSACGRTVGAAALRQQVSRTLARGYRGTTFRGAVLGGSTSRRVAVTFDDGELSVLEHALPILNELGVPGTVFVAVGPIGAPGHLGWDDLEVLAGAGWEIGSHTMTHARLTEVSDAALDEELSGSREEIERVLGRPCVSIAYPYGAFDARVRAAAARAGYAAGCTSGGTLRQMDILTWPRVGVDGADGELTFRIKTSGLGRALRGTRLGRPLEHVGRAARLARSA